MKKELERGDPTARPGSCSREMPEKSNDFSERDDDPPFAVFPVVVILLGGFRPFSF
eukprot:CAMPEP_0197175662 /NCGR_PEP_ID=MMETSP1423-20130617/1820_1 /TAXON_ID=476441 /ORGANISM="Pseudo-nitzschia heimii, Strain UNC1101" /LENGTH=55 /DNA_ID=CAMNT_0042624871 /DNA_START=44 /DNA_END=208 /DNA_ORIENTATION=+